MISPKNYRVMNFIQNNLALGLLTLAIIIVDRLVKFYVAEYISVGQSIPVLGKFFQITLVSNIGAAFGMFQGFSWFFILASCIVFGLVVFYYQKIILNRWLVFTTAFILGGTVGNMLDRIFFGHVIDYIDFIFWPAFNISDMALTTGAIMLIIFLFKKEKHIGEEGDDRIEYARY